MLSHHEWSAFDRGAMARSLSASIGSTSSSSLQFQEDCEASSINTDRTILIGGRASARPSSPAPLLYVSVSLPQPPAHRPFLSQSVETAHIVAGLVQSPERCKRMTEGLSRGTAAAADLYPASKKTCDEHQEGEDALRHAEMSPAVHTAETRNRIRNYSLTAGESRSDATQDDNDTIELTSSDNGTRDSSTTASRAAQQLEEAWGVLWTHVFPLHLSPFLSVRDVLEVAQVCRTAYEALQLPWVWRTLAAQHFGVIPAQVERTFLRAARQWHDTSEIPLACDSVGLVMRLSTMQVQVCEQTSLAAPRLNGLDSALELEDENDSNASFAFLRSTSSSTVAATEASTANSASDQDEEDENEFNTTQVPRPTGEGAETALRAESPPRSHTRSGDGAAATHVSVFALEVDEEQTEGEGMTSADFLTASVLRNVETIANTPTLEVATSPPRFPCESATLHARSRYLWQTAAAAMESPSSPAASSCARLDAAAAEEAVLPSDDSRDGVASAATGHASSETRISSTVPAHFRQQAADAAAAAVRSSLLAAASIHTATRTLSASGVDKCGCSARLPMHDTETLPPPTPTQLEDDEEENDAKLFSMVETTQTAEGSSAVIGPLPTFAARLTRRHPSYALEVATDVTVLPPNDALGVSSLHAAAATATPYCFTVCRATAERSLFPHTSTFPWRQFTRYLHLHRVEASLVHFRELSRRAREALCRGEWETAYGSLSRIVHVLCQANSCTSVEHLVELSRALVRRAFLCRHRGHLNWGPAFTDLCTAALLCPEEVRIADLEELAARADLLSLTPVQWWHLYDAAAHTASPLALLGLVAQVPLLFPHDRSLCFCAAVTAYVKVQRTLGHSLAHLLCRAAACATPGTEEELIVRALRETAQAKQQAQHGASARAACATADYALSLMPLPVRTATDALRAAWVRDCFPSEAAVSSLSVRRWAETSAESLSFLRETALDVRWLSWLTYEVHYFVYEQVRPPSKWSGASALMSLVLAPTCHDRADALVRLAVPYWSTVEVPTEDLVPSLPRGARRRRVAQYLLQYALQLRPLHVTAAVLLSRVYAYQDVEEEEEVETSASGEEETGASRASAVLTECIHHWAQRFSMLDMAKRDTRHPHSNYDVLQHQTQVLAVPLASYVHRRERCPEWCFIPSELLVGRHCCLHAVADLAEATEQHPTLSYPYQMRAAMAMDRGYHFAAILEMNRIVRLTLESNDVALRVRFLQDATEMELQRVAAAAAAGAATTASVTNEASHGSTSAPALSWLTPITAASTTSAAANLPASQLLPLYRTSLSKMSGLLTLLRTPEPAHRDDEESLSTSLSSMQLMGRRFASRDTLPPRSLSTSEYGEGHVSRVASLAFSEGDLDPYGAARRLGGSSSVSAASDAVALRAFLDELLPPV